jgi:hypothetical protein
MADIQLQQTDRLLEGLFPRSIPRQSDNQAIHNVVVSLYRRDVLLLQVLSAHLSMHNLS